MCGITVFKEVAIPRTGTEVGKQREVVKLTMLLLLTNYFLLKVFELFKCCLQLLFDQILL